MKKVHTLKSGHKLTLNIASLAAASNLRHTIANELHDSVRVDGISEAVVFALISGDPDRKKNMLLALAGGDVNVIWSLITALLGSRRIEAAIAECAKVCMLDTKGPDESIVWETTFEPAEARRDLIPVALEVMKENLAPFFEDLLSSLPTQGKAKDEIQK